MSTFHISLLAITFKEEIKYKRNKKEYKIDKKEC